MSGDYYSIKETFKRRGIGVMLRKIFARKAFLVRSRVRRCLCCRKVTLVLILDSAGEAQRCIRCGANLRYELIADFVRANVPDLNSRDILELDPSSPLRPILADGRNYTRTFWSDQLARGSMRGDGARCEDLTETTFSDASFDLIVSSEVLEHIEQLPLALAEVKRILRPGGIHVFTVPVDGAHPTIQRAVTRPNGQIDHLIEPEYHGDPEGGGQGILAYWTFGTDACKRLTMPGLVTTVGAERRSRGGDLLRQVFVSRKARGSEA